MLPRGTTPDIIYKFKKIKVADISVCYLSIAQNNTKLVTKELSDAYDVDTENDSISWRLTQQDTLKFDENISLEVQIKYKTNDGRVYTSKVSKVNSYKDLKNEVI